MLYDLNARVRRDHPREPGVWFEFKPLSGREARKAKAAQAERAIALVSGMSPDRLAQLRTMRPDGAAAVTDHSQTYDVDTVLEAGIVAWSYPAPLDAIGSLDEGTSDWAFNEIMALSLRDAAEGEASGVESVQPTDPAPALSLVN